MRRPDRTIPRVALYAGRGADDENLDFFVRLFADHDCGELTRVDSAEVSKARLRSFDLLILPGGRGSQICTGLGTAGKEAVAGYVAQGGGVVGVCAGAYALSSKYPWSLGLVPVQVLDTKHWRRGQGRVAIKLTREGRALFDHGEEVVEVAFSNGPVLAPFPDGTEPRYTVLATYGEDIVHPRGMRGLMPGSPAALLAEFGEGRVLCIGPHFEETEGKQHLIAQAIRQLTGQPLGTESD